jgi:TRAP-type C4-dicarboxylate transport system permease small subunit
MPPDIHHGEGGKIMSGSPGEEPEDGSMRAVNFVERVAAILLGLVTVLIFVSVVGRYLFARPIPDAFDLSRLTLAVAVMWGFASIGFRGSHIKVDLLAQAMPHHVRKWFDAVAWFVLLVFTVGLFWKIGGRLLSQWPRGELTMDLRLPHWPFLVAILLGLAMALWTTSARIWRVIYHDDGLEPHETTPDDEMDGSRHD